jgi:hypothetical protein
VERSRDDKASNGERKKTSCGLSDNFVEFLIHTIHTTKEETHAHDQEQIRQNTADQRGLDDEHLVLDEGKNRDDQFDCISKGGIQKTTDRFSSSVISSENAAGISRPAAYRRAISSVA